LPQVVLTADFQAKLIDCGLAQYKAGFGHVLAAGTVATTAGLPVGTPKYMCPQYLKGNKAFDAKSEVFSVGVVLLELVTGRVQGPDCDHHDECIEEEGDVVSDGGPARGKPSV
jgi:serine/threonine protein kinase